MNEAPAPSLVGSEAETLDEAFHRHACNNRQIANEKKSAFILGDLFSQMVIKSPRRPVDPTAGRGARLAAAALSFAFENRADKEVSRRLRQKPAWWGAEQAQLDWLLLLDHPLAMKFAS